MKNIKLVLSLAVVGAVFFNSCSDDKFGPSIFDTDPPERNSFDLWLLNNFVKVYNVETFYKYEDIEATNGYNVIPADLRKADTLAQIVKYVWFGAYDELLGVKFLKANSPRTLQYIGSYAYDQMPNGSASITMGSAEGGMKVTLYGVNSLLLDAEYLNSAYFHTMHHEFNHILNQKIGYGRPFTLLMPAEYIGGDWKYWAKKGLEGAALSKGFITAYAMMEYNEDFSEIYSTYVTSTAAQWEDMMTYAALDSVKYDENNNVVTTNVAWYSDGKGRQWIEKKLAIVRDYYQTSWDINLDSIRAVILRRSSEVPTMHYETFDDLH